MTDQTPDPALEAEARALFEADPISDLEASWDYLAQYKKDDWRQTALIKRNRHRRYPFIKRADTGPCVTCGKQTYYTLDGVRIHRVCPS